MDVRRVDAGIGVKSAASGATAAAAAAAPTCGGLVRFLPGGTRTSTPRGRPSLGASSPRPKPTSRPTLVHGLLVRLLLLSLGAKLLPSPQNQPLHLCAAGWSIRCAPGRLLLEGVRRLFGGGWRHQRVAEDIIEGGKASRT